MTRTYLVTGASRGIGARLVQHLHADGHVVIAAVRDPGALATVDVPVVALDVTDPSSLDSLAARLAEHVDAIDVLVNNAGIKQVHGHVWAHSAGPLDRLEADAVAAVLRTNLIGPLMVTRSVLPLLRRPGGVIVNVSSLLGSLVDNVGLDYAYNCSKAALNMSTVQLQRELVPEGISAVSLNPGWIRTDMAGDEAPLEPEQATREIADLLGRVDAGFGGRFVDRFGDDVAW